MPSKGASGERASGACLGPSPPGTAPMAANSGSSGPVMQGRGGATAVVVQPRAREAFTPRELADAYKDFEKHGPQHMDPETGLKASAYRFGGRVLIVYEQTGVVILVHPTPHSVRRRHEGASALGSEHRAGAGTSAGPIARAYGRFLKLPVPVVLAVLWLVGALILGAVVVAVYGDVVWLGGKG
jgi:hypothetical protein